MAGEVTGHAYNAYQALPLSVQNAAQMPQAYAT